MSDYNLLENLADEQATSLRYQIEVGASLSTESRLQTIVDGAKGTFNSFLESAATFLNGLKVGNYKLRETKLSSAQGAALREEGWPTVRNKTVKVPLGFSAKYSDYIKDVEAVMGPIEALGGGLKLGIVRIAQILNEPDRLKAQSGIRELEKNLNLCTTAQYDALMANYKNGDRAEVMVNAIADNLTEFTETYASVDTLNKRLSRVDMVGVQGQIHRMADLVAELHKTVSAEETKDVSGIIAGQLSDLIYRMGMTASILAMVASGVGDLSDSLIENAKTLTAPVIAA